MLILYIKFVNMYVVDGVVVVVLVGVDVLEIGVLVVVVFVWCVMCVVVV